MSKKISLLDVVMELGEDELAATRGGWTNWGGCTKGQAAKVLGYTPKAESDCNKLHDCYMGAVCHFAAPGDCQC